MNSLKRDLALVRLELGREVPDQHADDDEHHPEQQTLQRRVQAEPPTALSLKISTACEGSVTRNASSIPCPATHTIRSVASTTSGTASRAFARHLPVDEDSPAASCGRPAQRAETVARPAISHGQSSAAQVAAHERHLRHLNHSGRRCPRLHSGAAAPTATVRRREQPPPLE